MDNLQGRGISVTENVFVGGYKAIKLLKLVDQKPSGRAMGWAAVCATCLPLVGAATNETTTLDAFYGRLREPSKKRAILIAVSCAIVFSLVSLVMFLRCIIIHSRRRAHMNPPQGVAVEMVRVAVDPAIIDTFPRYVFPCEGHPTIGDTCPICGEDFQDGEIVISPPTCAHIFHVVCIQRWIVGQSQRTCPTCRSAF